MIKQKLTNVSYLLLASVFLLSIWSCEKEELESSEIDSIEDSEIFNTRVYSGHEILKEHKWMKEQINKFNSQKKSERGIESAHYSFSLDTTRILKLKSNKFETYTFNIHRDKPNPTTLENYVLIVYNDGSYNQWLVEYPILESGNDKTYDFENSNITVIRDDTLLKREFGHLVPCLKKPAGKFCVEFPCGGSTGSGEHMPGDDCNAAFGDQPFTSCIDAYSTGPCSGSGDSDGDDSGVGNGVDIGVISGVGSGNNSGGIPPNDVPPEEDPGEGDMNDCFTRDCDGKPIIIPLPEPSEEDEEICITNLAEELNLDSEVSACLSNVNNDNICEINTSISDYLADNQSDSESISNSREFVEILCEIPDAKWDRFKKLKDKIEENPWVLLQDCAQQNGMDISNYQDLYNHEIPQACQTKLDNLGEGYSNQPISDGNVPLTNMDYFSVEITQMPDLDGDGNPDTEAEVYQAFREKFTDLASGEKEEFESPCDVPFDLDDIIDISWEFNPPTPNEEALFLSSNPISSILLIDAGANNPAVDFNADLGAIMVSDFTSNNWTISTIQTPDTETQPFSGNRQWGWLINDSGNFEIYTRAVDVARVSDDNLGFLASIYTDIGCQQDTYYDIAEATWKNMQQETEDWINDDDLSNGGQASKNEPKAVRIDKEKIKEILTAEESEGTIEDLLSNCN